jgi:GINS complex subunit 3
MRHLDIRNLLCEEEKINCTFRGNAPGLGFLDPTSRAIDLSSQSKVPLPLWLAENMATARYVDIEMPKYFNSKMREAILAGPLAINFRSFSFHFFEMGLRLSHLIDNAHLKELRTAFCGERYKALMDRALAE